MTDAWASRAPGVVGRPVTDERGNVALAMALVLLPISMLIGFAIDQSAAVNRKLEAQSALDAAVLAAVRVSDPVDARAAFDSMITAAGFDATKATYTASPSPTFAHVSGTYADAVPTSLSAVMGVNELPYSVDATAEAPIALDGIDIDIDQAFGQFSKRVLFKVTRPDGTEETVVTVDYQVTDLNGAAARGTGTTTATPSVRTPVGPYIDFWAEMIVDDFTVGHEVTYSTRDPDMRHHLFVDGEQLEKGAAHDIFDIVECDNQVSYAWEDHVHGFHTQDIFFDVRVWCAGANDKQAYLVD